MKKFNLLCPGEKNTFFSSMDAVQGAAAGQCALTGCALVLPGQIPWQDTDALADLRRRLHPADPAGWYVTYPFDAGDPGCGEKYRAALLAAGYRKVWMVADMDAALSYYRSRDCRLGRADGGQALAMIRPCGDGRICVTIVREGEYRTVCGAPEADFFDSCVPQGTVDAVLYCCEEPMPEALRRKILSVFAPKLLLEDWKEEYYMTGLQLLAPALIRSHKMISVWNDALNTGKNLTCVIAIAFHDYFVPTLRPLSDVGQHFYDALDAWASKASFHSPTLNRRLRMDKDLIFFRAQELLYRRTDCGIPVCGEIARQAHDGMNLAVRQVAVYFEEAIGRPGLFPLGSLERSGLRHRVNGMFTPEIQARLAAMMRQNWDRATEKLTDTWSVKKRYRQLNDWSFRYGSHRKLARTQAARWLNGHLDLNGEREIFAREVLQMLRRSLFVQVQQEVDSCYLARADLLAAIALTSAFDPAREMAEFEDEVLQWHPQDPVPDVPSEPRQEGEYDFDSSCCTNPDAGKDWIDEMIEVWD